ncbi:MAG: transketolase C-terminal domain-containing protein [Polyangia bacterium]
MVVAAGITLREAIKAADQLQSEGIAIRVIDAYSVKPIDADGLRAAAQAGQNRVIVVEDHWIEGGLGDAVLEVFAESGSVRVRKLAVCELPHSGKPEELLDLYGLSARKIAQAVRAFCK